MGLLDEIRRNSVLSQIDPRTVVGALSGSPVPTAGLAYGVGQGLGNQMLGVSQAVRDPAEVWRQSQALGQATAADPKGVATGILGDIWQRATSGPQGLGEVIGENLSPRMRTPKGLLEARPKVEKWYDKYSKSWVVQRKDADGNQIGDADYVYTKDEAKQLERQYQRELAEAEAAAPKRPKGLLELDVYHGTPHVFEPEPEAPLGKFRLDKVGTGEGNQVYGHGIYVAEAPGTAQSYRTQNARWEPVGIEMPRPTTASYPRLPEERAMQHMEAALDEFPYGVPDESAAYARARRSLRQEIKEYQDAIPEDSGWALGAPGKKRNAVVEDLEKALKTLNAWQLKDVTFKRGGAVYKADLADEAIPKMMDWEKRLEEQPDVLASMRKAFESGLQEKYGPNMGDAYTFDDYIRGRAGGRAEDWTAIPAGRIPAKQAYKFLASGLGGDPALASRKLAEQGIPGIKYWDQQSRIAGQGTRNFVLFEPELAKIIGRE